MGSENEKKFDKEDSYKNLDRVNFWIHNSDAKASFVLAFIGVFMTVGLTSSLMSDNFKLIFKSLLTIKIECKPLLALVITINLMFLIFFIMRSVFYLLDVLTARTDIKELEDSSTVKASKIFFATIADNKFDEFKIKLNSMCERDILEDINSQTYINSKICTAKFQNFKKAIKNVKRSIFCVVILVVLMFIFNLIF